MTRPAPRVVVADDHPLFRLGLTVVLREHGFEVVGQAGRGDDAVALAHRHRPDLVVLDVRMPGIDGLEACRRVAALRPAPRIVMLSTYDEPAVLSAAREAGAAAFFGKGTSPDEVARWCRRLLDEPRLRLVPAVDDLPALSDRELEVLVLLAEGLSNKAIAAALGLSPETVKDHCTHLYAKFGTGDRMATVRRARNLGFFAAADGTP